MAVADVQYCFLYVDIGDTGRHSDGSIFSNGSSGRAVNNAELGLPSADSSARQTVQFQGLESFHTDSSEMKPSLYGAT